MLGWLPLCPTSWVGEERTRPGPRPKHGRTGGRACLPCGPVMQEADRLWVAYLPMLEAGATASPRSWWAACHSAIAGVALVVEAAALFLHTAFRRMGG